MKPSPLAKRAASTLHEAKKAACLDGVGRMVAMDGVDIAWIEVVEVRDREAERMAAVGREIYTLCAFVHLTPAGVARCALPWRLAL